MIKNSFPFLLAMRNFLIRFEIPRNTKHKEYYGEEICIEFRVAKARRKTFCSMFNACLHYIFKVEFFLQKLS